jgi:hypothetical protein
MWQAKRCRDWAEASYVLVELADEARWFRCAGCRRQKFAWDT